MELEQEIGSEFISSSLIIYIREAGRINILLYLTNTYTVPLLHATLFPRA